MKAILTPTAPTHTANVKVDVFLKIPWYKVESKPIFLKHDQKFIGKQEVSHQFRSSSKMQYSVSFFIQEIEQ